MLIFNCEVLNMSKKYVFITDKAWFETTTLSNPIVSLDEKLERIYPEYYSVDYDLRILATDSPTKEEKAFPFYNDYRDKYGRTDINVLQEAARCSQAKSVFLNGFNQECFDYIAPLIKDTTEILYLFKCRYMKDLSSLSNFTNLKCLHIYGNNTLKELWDMDNNSKLKVLSFTYVTKLQHLNGLCGSKVEYITIDSVNNSGDLKNCSIDDIGIFDEIPNLKHLKLGFNDCSIDY